MSGPITVTLVRERETSSKVVFVQVSDPDNVEVRRNKNDDLRLVPAPNALIPSLYLDKSEINGESALTVTITPA